MAEIIRDDYVKHGGATGRKKIRIVGPSGVDLSSTESHGPVATAAWMADAYTPVIDRYVGTSPVQQCGQAVWDLLAQIKNHASIKEALGGK